MTVGILKEPESRVAITPELIVKSPSISFLVEYDAGAAAGYANDMFEAAGAKIEKKRKHVLEHANVLVSIGFPDDDSVKNLKPGAILIGQLDPFRNLERLKQLARAGVSAFSLDLLPRTTRAQPMDVLSSQSNLAGYQAVVCAVSSLGRVFPMMTTAAGTVLPARVLVIGAGVAGLQAIATAKRLGAIVSAFDVRVAAKEQVESLGATFIQVECNEDGEGAGGYAKEVSCTYKRAQEMRLSEVLPRQDVVITTAQIPHQPAPKIITKDMVSKMKDGALIIDLAGEYGGNCELSEYGEWILFENKRIFAPKQILDGVAHTASFLFSSNLIAFIKGLLRCDGNAISFDVDDEIVKSTLVTHGGLIPHAQMK
jgi:NAD(P) transhydrogenase subunit alpha